MPSLWHRARRVRAAVGHLPQLSQKPLHAGTVVHFRAEDTRIREIRSLAPSPEDSRVERVCPQACLTSPTARPSQHPGWSTELTGAIWIPLGEAPSLPHGERVGRVSGVGRSSLGLAAWGCPHPDTAGACLQSHSGAAALEGGPQGEQLLPADNAAARGTDGWRGQDPRLSPGLSAHAGQLPRFLG